MITLYLGTWGAGHRRAHAGVDETIVKWLSSDHGIFIEIFAQILRIDSKTAPKNIAVGLSAVLSLNFLYLKLLYT